MGQLEINWGAAPEWAYWAAQDSDGGVFYYAEEPFITTGEGHRWLSDSGACIAAVTGVLRVGTKLGWRESLVQRPQTVRIHQDNDGAGMLRAQIAHLLEDMTSEQLDALYAHVRKQLDAAKFDELNRQLDKPFGEVPREWQLKAFEAFLDGATLALRQMPGEPVTAWPGAFRRDVRYRIEPKQS